MRKYLGELGLIITAIIWGSGFVATSIALSYYTPYQTMAIRFLVGGLLLSLLFYKKISSISKQLLTKGVILGTILYIAFALQTVGLQYTTPSKNAFITAINVVIVPLIAFIFYKKRLNRFEVIGAILAVIGVGFMSLQLSGTAINIGDFLTFLCAIGFAFHIVYTSKFVENEDPIQLTIVQLFTAAVIAFIVITVKGELAMSFEPVTLLPVLYLGLFSTAVAYVLQTSGQKLVSETKTAIILSTEALWGMVFSIIILSEIITVRMMIGAVLILFAIVVSETKLNFSRSLLRQRL